MSGEGSESQSIFFPDVSPLEGISFNSCVVTENVQETLHWGTESNVTIYFKKYSFLLPSMCLPQRDFSLGPVWSHCPITMAQRSLQTLLLYRGCRRWIDGNLTQALICSNKVKLKLEKYKENVYLGKKGLCGICCYTNTFFLKD